MTQPQPDPARARFFAITGLRISAAMMIAVGIIIGFGQGIEVGPELKLPLGLALVALGAFEMLVVIPILVRRWRSAQEDNRK